jgi:selenocysteine lyase/cysteine desulfurase
MIVTLALNPDKVPWSRWPLGGVVEVELADAVQLWDPEPGWLNTASYGLPPRPAWDALQSALADWRGGRTSWEPWDEFTGRARAAFSMMAGVASADVAVGSTVSGLLAPVAAMLPSGARVVVPEIEFTSNLFPWLVHADRGVTVDTVPLDKLADAIGPGTTLVAFSLVQSATGQIAPADDILAAARSHGALVCVDASQACGWLPVRAGSFDVVACAAYKWLMAPRGAAFCYLAPELRERIRPLQAGWYAGEDVHESYYGPPLRLASSARRFDISPAWFSFVGAAPAMELLNQVGIEAVREHNVGLARQFLAGLGLPPTGSAIVTVTHPDAARRLAAAGVRAAVRAGRARLSFHLYTTESDVDRALDALTSH